MSSLRSNQEILAKDSAPVVVPNGDDRNLSLLCASVRCALDRNGEDLNRLRYMIGTDTDWCLLIRLSHRHAVFPHLFRTALRLGIGPRIFSQLLTEFERMALWNTMLATELVILASALQRAGIDFLSHKGPAMALALYGSFLLREYGDLDILLPANRISDARRVLIENGYEDELPEQVTALSKDSLPFGYELRLVGKGGKISVGLHWKLAGHLDWNVFDFGLPGNRREICLGGRPVKCLSGAALLLSLTAHGGKDHWRRLGWIADIAQLLAVEPDLDWTRTLDLAREKGLRRLLFLGIRLAEIYFSVAVPDTIQEEIDRDQEMLNTLTEYVGSVTLRRRLTDEGRWFDGEMSRKDHKLFYVRSRERLRDRLRHYPGILHQYDWKPPVDLEAAILGFAEVPAILRRLLLLLAPFRWIGRDLARPVRRKLRSAFHAPNLREQLTK